MDRLKTHLVSEVSAVEVQGTVGRYRCWCMWDAVRAGNTLVAAAAIQYVQAQHLGLTGNLCRSLRDFPLCLQLPGTAGGVKAELSSSNQGYTR